MPKDRLDRLLVERGLAETRSRAQAIVRAGEVEVDGQVFDKPGMRVSTDAELHVRQGLPYVSRGGFKLAAALDAFGIDPEGRTCLDVGASTGGFTDVLLQRGAAKVYAVDVGRGQLAWSLRQDERVICMERTDIRDLKALPAPVSLAAVDVAFISLTQVLPQVATLLEDDGQAVILIKPQFEAGREQVGKGGVVRDPEVHRAVLRHILGWATEHGWTVVAATAAPITGSAGNQEFLAHLARPGAGRAPTQPETAVHEALAAADETPDR